MEAKELRIGNYVKAPLSMNMEIIIPNTDVEILGFNYSNLVFHCKPTAYKNWEIPASHCSPIPLTEEWLIKLGFEINGFSDYVLDNNGLLRLLAGGDNTENAGYVRMHQNGNWIGLNHIKYVHQLQNLYFARTGEELTIKQ